MATRLHLQEEIKHIMTQYVILYYHQYQAWDKIVINSVQRNISYSSAEGGTDLEAIEICVEDIATLDVSDQSHCQLLIGLISDVHHGGDVYRQPIHP